MAVMFRTPDILDNITRTTHYNEEDVYQEETLEVQTNEVKLIKELAKMVDNNIPLSQTQLMKRTGVGEGMLTHYDYIFNDTIEMLGLFFPVEENSKVKESPKYKEAKELLDKHDIHDFDTLKSNKIQEIIDISERNKIQEIINILESKAIKKIIAIALTAGINNDKYAILVDDLYNSGIVNKTFNEKAFMPTEAAFSFLGQRYIHPDFTNLNLNEMGRLVFEKYKRVQELKAEYNRLKAEQ